MLCSYSVMVRANRAQSGRHGGTGDPTDEVLVAATLDGDRNAYRNLVERHQDRLFRVAFEVVKNQHDAEDIVQESFVKAFLSLDKFKAEASFFTWLYRITFNMAVDFQRRSQRRGGQHFEYKEQLGVSTGEQGADQSFAGGNGFAGESIEGPYDALLRKQTGRKLNAAFAGLSDEHRAVITLREVDGLDYEEIAKALRIPRGTVMSRLFYARKMLQRALQDVSPESTATGAHDEVDKSELLNLDTQSTEEERRRLLKRAPG